MQFEAIGTQWNIDCDEPISDALRVRILDDVNRRIETFEQTHSRFRPDSLVARMSEKAGTYVLPTDAEPLLRLYQDAYHITHGAVTPLIGQVLIDAGYDSNYSLMPKTLHYPPTWEEALEFQPPTTLVVKRPVALDFGAFGKGHLVDLVSGILWGHGLRTYCINAGGDILQRDARNGSMRIGLEHPQDFSKAIGVATIANRSLCGSAGSRRKWADFTHIINPHTLSSPTDILATWASAKTTLLSDAMATCLYFTDPDVLLKYYAFDYLVMYADSTVKRSTGFPRELFVG